MLKVAAYTGGSFVPSARFRVRQYISLLRDFGIEFTEITSKLGTYPPKNKLIRPFWALGTLSERLPDIVSSYRYDVTLLQREMLSTYVTLEPFTKRPRVLDVDDAIWLHRDGAFARRLAEICDAVICGNTFLAEQFSRWNYNVSVIPTAVDTDRYHPLASDTIHEKQIIGWSGTSSGFNYLYGIEEALGVVLKKHSNVKLRIVADKMPEFNSIPLEQMEFIRWSPENEVRVIQDMTVGIMPLEDSLWARGKCSYKMLTYMACSIPVAVSPVGMNADVLSLGKNGLGAISKDEWIDSLDWLLSNQEKARQMGKVGREHVLKHFSIHALVPQLADKLTRFRS
ncbi:MAG: glycosyltransferase family 4 protein [Thermincolia bacterium]